MSHSAYGQAKMFAIETRLPFAELFYFQSFNTHLRQNTATNQNHEFQQWAGFEGHNRARREGCVVNT